MSKEMEELRKIGYDILINHFESFLRKFLIKVLTKNYTETWRDYIPNSIIKRLRRERKIDITTMDIESFFEELYLFDLKSITYKSYTQCIDLLSNLPINLFGGLMDELNKIRIRVAHPKENFSSIDIDIIIRDIKSICRGKAGKEMIEFIDNKEYIDAFIPWINYFYQF